MNKNVAMLLTKEKRLLPLLQSYLPVAFLGSVVVVLFALLNTLVLKAQGADGMFILSVCLQMMMLSMLILEGSADAVTGIGGVMLGESNIDSYRSLVTGILKKSAIGLVAISAILMIYPDMLARIFGASDEMLVTARGPLRVFCLSLLPLGFVYEFQVS